MTIISTHNCAKRLFNSCSGAFLFNIVPSLFDPGFYTGGFDSIPDIRICRTRVQTDNRNAGIDSKRSPFCLLGFSDWLSDLEPRFICTGCGRRGAVSGRIFIGTSRLADEGLLNDVVALGSHRLEFFQRADQLSPQHFDRIMASAVSAPIRGVLMLVIPSTPVRTLPKAKEPSREESGDNSHRAGPDCAV